MKSILILALISCTVVLTPTKSVLAQERRISKPAAVTAETSDKELDGLNGPVRRVKVEIAKITVKDGNFTEGPRVLRETSTYDPKGKKIDTVAHPVEGTSLPGKEEYRYDDNGNIVEMILRGEDGSILSKETYTYEIDEIGNWKKMTSSVAIYENGKLSYEPVEVTYRTISYYFGQAVDKLISAGKKPEPATPKSNETASLKSSETRPPKINQAANTSTERISVPTGSAVSGPTNSLTQPTLKPIESNDDKVVTPRDAASSVDSNAQPAKSADELVDKHVTNTKTSSASQPITPSTSQPTSKVEDKKAPLTGSATSSTEVKETESNSKPAASEKAAGVPGEKAPAPTSVVETSKASVPTNVVETGKSPAPTSVVETNKAPTEKAAAPTRAEASPPNAAASAYEQGLSHLAANRFSEAVKFLSESARRNPNDAQTYLKLGVAYSSLGQYKEALAVLKMALQIKREVVDAQGFYHLGTAYANLGKNSEALNAFKQALYIIRASAVDPQTKGNNAPPLSHVHHSLGAVYYSLQRPNEAIKELKRAVELNPKLADAYFVLALSYLAVGNRMSADTQRTRLRTLDATLADKLDKVLSSPDSGVHGRCAFPPCPF